MSVYVDPMFAWPPTKRWPYPEACHMIADTKKELVKFALDMKLPIAWLQKKDPMKIPHFDLTRNKRNQAVKKGAIEINTKEMSRRIKLHRRKMRSKNK